MSNLDDFRGLCPVPFLDASKFPNRGGNIDGRLCSHTAGLTCCLPCPATDWLYPPSFINWYRAAEALSTIGLVVALFLLVSWITLPVEKTKRHFLSVCLIIGIMLEGLAFVIPLAARPQQCHNFITPNDMYSDLTCAFSGAFIIAGGLTVTMWVTLRALAMHLQICWNIVTGEKFFWTALIGGWGVIGIVFAVAMAFTGASYRFGDICHVNPKNAMATFWIPLLTCAGFAGLCQLLTFLYCVKVFLSSIWSGDTNDGSTLPSHNASHGGTHSAKLVYQRIKKILWLQWRSITTILFLLGDIIFFAIVWIKLDTATNKFLAGNVEDLVPFISCLIVNSGKKDMCYKVGQDVMVSENTSIAVLIMLALSGIQTGFLLTRKAYFTGWTDFFRARFAKKREFVSLDAKRFSSDPRNIEMHPVTSPQRIKTGETMISRTETWATKPEQSPQANVQRDQQTWYSPSLSNPSNTRTPSLNQSPRPGWDASDTFAAPSMQSSPPRMAQSGPQQRNPPPMHGQYNYDNRI